MARRSLGALPAFGSQLAHSVKSTAVYTCSPRGRFSRAVGGACWRAGPESQQTCVRVTVACIIYLGNSPDGVLTFVHGFIPDPDASDAGRKPLRFAVAPSVSTACHTYSCTSYAWFDAARRAASNHVACRRRLPVDNDTQMKGVRSIVRLCMLVRGGGAPTLSALCAPNAHLACLALRRLGNVSPV